MDFNNLDQQLGTYLSASKLPGFSLAISDRERTLHTFTYTSDRESNPLITPDTLFEIGSIGKSFTSILFQQLVDAGSYDLHKPVNEYLPWFDIPSEFEPITTHHLLCHTAGIINGTDFSGDTVAEVYALRETQTASPPGTFFHYSNVGYKLLGAVLEQVTQESYPALVRERILDPLDLDNVYPAITHDLRSQMAVGYIPLYDDRPAPLDHPIAPGVRYETATADGCIVSNSTDLATYMRMFMQGGQEGVLSPEGYARIVQPTIQIDDDTHYGYGLAISDKPEGQFISHSGGMAGGYITQMMWHVESNSGFVAMFNAAGVPGIGEIFEWLQQVLAAWGNEGDLPSLEAPANPFIVTDADRYAGSYFDGFQPLNILARGDRIFLEHDGTEQTLAMRAPDRFTCDHPDFDRFIFAFQRDDDDNIESVTHGEQRYLSEGVDRPQVDVPAEWHAYRGHYRSHNPWLSAFRVLLRAGRLYFQAGSHETPLVPLGNGVFRVGEDERLPERLRFDLLIRGQAIRAQFNTALYYRTFTP
ncbi:beta-lactamase family protein [Chloroflexi bacterium TSY]|nr:beta-lactamase family protein [Chloroflexi bacterium TSY]